MLRRVVDLIGRLRGAAPSRTVPRRPHPGQGVPPPGGPSGPGGAGGAAVHAHDYDGPVQITYAPAPNGHPDPGEVVWTWVPYEEDPTVGKDRPVVVLGRALQAPGRELAVVLLSSKEHAGDPRWVELGTGTWDAEGRPSSVRVDRVLAVAPGAVRREGATLDRARFERVAAAVLAAGPGG